MNSTLRFRPLLSLAAVLGMAWTGSAHASQPDAGGESVIAGAGKVKFQHLLQAWTLNDTTATAAKLNFRVRRTELKFSGSVAENSRWIVMIDPAKALRTGAISASNDNKALQEIAVAFEPVERFEVVAGQFKIPTTAEGLDSSAGLLLPERAFVSRNYGDKREPGILAVYQEKDWKVSAMVSNGAATNVDDTSNPKDLSVRAEASLAEELRVGAYTQAGDFNYSVKGRWGANARATVAGLTLRAEGVRATDSGVNSTGLNFDGGYQLTEAWQPVARFETFGNGTFTARSFTLGTNYFFAKHGAKIQAAYGILTDMAGNSGSYSPASGAKGSLLTLAFQASI